MKTPLLLSLRLTIQFIVLVAISIGCSSKTSKLEGTWFEVGYTSNPYAIELSDHFTLGLISVADDSLYHHIFNDDKKTFTEALRIVEDTLFMELYDKEDLSEPARTNAYLIKEIADNQIKLYPVDWPGDFYAIWYRYDGSADQHFEIPGKDDSGRSQMEDLKDPTLLNIIKNFADFNAEVYAWANAEKIEKEKQAIEEWQNSDKNGVYSYSSYQIRFAIQVTGDTWRGETVLVSGMGDSYDNQNAIRSYGKIIDYELYNNVGAKIGTFDHKGIHTSVGNQRITLTLE
jgi:hypothetical protein